MKGRVQALMAVAVVAAGVGFTSLAVAGPIKNLINGLTGGGTNVLGVVSLNDSGNDALVNLDIGGGNNLLGAAIGAGSKPLVGANVATTGLGGNTDVSVSLLGLGLDVNLDLQGDAGDGSSSDRRVLVGSLGDGGTFKVTCAVNNTRQLLQIAANGKVTASEIRAWQRFASVQVEPIRLCPTARKQIAKLLAHSEKIRRLQSAAASDQLIAASLERTGYDAGDVVAVQQRMGQLVVYVY